MRSVARSALAPLSLLLATALVWTWAATAWLAIPWHVAGPSMMPTLRPGDRVLVDLWSYRQRRPRTGEIVLLRGPDGRTLVKRVGEISRTGERLRLLGDNPDASLDSRRFGPLPASSVRGRVFWCFWPPERFGPVR